MLKIKGDSRFVHRVTGRLRLRRFDISDLESLVDYRSRPSVARYQGWELPYAIDDAMQLLKEMKGRHPGMPGYWFQFAIQHLETGRMIGDCGIRVSSKDPTQADIGFTIHPKFQGQGYGSETILGVLEYAFQVLKLRRITAVTDVRNLASARLLKRVGMRLEGTMIESVRFKGKVGSEHHFAILKREWLARRKRKGGKR
jgi:RimJ/RimL family protein N-acetyltransferase